MIELWKDENCPVPVIEMSREDLSPAVQATARQAAYRPSPQFDGNLQVDPEVHLPSPGMDVDIAYYYNSMSIYDGFFSYAWTLSSNLLAQASGNWTVVTFTRGDGGVAAYEDDGLGNFTAQTPGVLNTLEKDTTNNLWKETTPQGVVTAYPLDTAGNITSVSYIEDAVGNLHTYAYSSGLLSTIEDAVGRKVSFSYDANSLLESIEDWAGRRTTFAYDTNTFPGKPVLTTLTGQSGCQTVYQYAPGPYPLSNDPLLTGIVDPNGYGTSYTYDNLKRVTERTVSGVGVTSYTYSGALMIVSNPDGIVTTNTADSNWGLGQIQNAYGEVTTNTYNASEQLAVHIDPLGNTYSYVYDNTTHDLVASVNPLLQRTSYVYDSYHNATSITYPDAAIATMIYGYAGSSFDTTGAKRKLQAMVDPLGNRTSYSYNGRGQVTTVEDALGYVTSFAYDDFGNQIGVVDPLGYATTRVYDLAGNVIATEDALGDFWTQTYDPQNRPLQSTDPLGNVTTVAYDSIGNRTVQIDPLGYRTSWTYNVFDYMVSQENALGHRVTFEYDSLGQRTGQVAALGYRTTYVYDSVGRMVAMVDALGHFHTTVYDAAGRIVELVDPLSYATTSVYDAASRRIATVNALGRITTTAYDVVGRVSAVENALGYATTSVYDLAGRQIAVVDANGGRNTTVYDARGSLVAAEDPLGAFTSYQYDAASHLVQRTDARNHITSYTVDALGRTAGVFYFDAARVTNTFDAAGRQTEMQDALGDTLYGYDNANRQTSVLYPTGIALTYAYDGVANRTSMVSPGDQRTTYAYDAAERLTGILNPYNEQTTIAYDALDRESKRILANGVTTDHTYDQAGRETVLANAKSDGSAVSIYTATYDAISDRLTVLEFDGARVTYSYDALSQLTQEQRVGANAYDLSYGYGPTGNRLTKTDSGALTTYTYNIADELLLVQPPTGQPTTMLYDANGNLALENAGGSLTTYTWDDENRLIALAEPTAGLSTFAYAPNGLRQRKETSAGTSLFIWDGQNVLLETDASLVAQARFTGFPGIWGGLASMHQGGGTSFFAFDQQASARELLSAAEAVSDTYLYTAFGEEIATSGTTENPHRYVGKFGYWRDMALLLDVRRRRLDVATGRWLSRDPISSWHEPHTGDGTIRRVPTPYVYVYNNPVNAVDPSGEQAIAIGLGIVAVGGVIWWLYHRIGPGGVVGIAGYTQPDPAGTGIGLCDPKFFCIGPIVKSYGEKYKVYIDTDPEMDPNVNKYNKMLQTCEKHAAE